MQCRRGPALVLLGLIVILCSAARLRLAFPAILHRLAAVPIWTQLAAVFLLVNIVAFPISVGYLPINVTSGYLFGVLPGAALVSASALFALTFATLLLRRCFRPQARRFLSQRASLRALVAALEAPTMVTKLLLLSRMAPIPFGLQNLIFSIPDVGVSKYALLSWIGLLPNQLLNAAVGASLRSLEARPKDDQTSTLRYFVVGIEIMSAAAIISIIFWRARQELNRIIRQGTVGYEQV